MLTICSSAAADEKVKKMKWWRGGDSLSVREPWRLVEARRVGVTGSGVKGSQALSVCVHAFTWIISHKPRTNARHPDIHCLPSAVSAPGPGTDLPCKLTLESTSAHGAAAPDPFRGNAHLPHFLVRRNTHACRGRRRWSATSKTSQSQTENGGDRRLFLWPLCRSHLTQARTTSPFCQSDHTVSKLSLKRPRKPRA